jgi:hypothetical protein
LDIILMVAAGGDAAARITDRQLQAAIAAPPCVHPKLAAVAVKDATPPDPAEKERNERARATIMDLLERLAVPAPL